MKGAVITPALEALFVSEFVCLAYIIVKAIVLPVIPSVAVIVVSERWGESRQEHDCSR